MNYQDAGTRNNFVFLNEKSINKFIKAATENRQTIIFFPGGMASSCSSKNILRCKQLKAARLQRSGSLAQLGDFWSPRAQRSQSLIA